MTRPEQPPTDAVQDPPAWVGPFKVGDMIIVYTGQVHLRRGLIGTITRITTGGLVLHPRESPSHPPLWFPATGITALSRTTDD